MAQQPQQIQVQNPPVSDPDNVPETLCDGQFNLSGTAHLATLTFTHNRPNATEMFANATLNPTAVVRARIVLTPPNLLALRDFLAANVKDVVPAEGAAPATGGATKH
jgi:hypothetical protein